MRADKNSFHFFSTRSVMRRQVRNIRLIEMLKSIVINPFKKGIYVDVKTHQDNFYLDIGCQYLEFTRIDQDTFQLTGLQQGCCPSPELIIQWSGVLWTRQGALEANQSLIAYALALNQTD